jgi:hypothetical protein
LLAENEAVFNLLGFSQATAATPATLNDDDIAVSSGNSQGVVARSVNPRNDAESNIRSSPDTEIPNVVPGVFSI